MLAVAQIARIARRLQPSMKTRCVYLEHPYRQVDVEFLVVFRYES